MKVIQNDIKTNEFKPFYLLYGEETYLINQFKKNLISAMVGDNTMNLTVTEDKTAADELNSIGQTLPFLSERRVIVLDHYKMTKERYDRLEALFKNMPEYLHIIITDHSVDKRTSFFKLVKSKGYVCELNTQSDSVLVTFIQDRLSEEGKKIEVDTAKSIIHRCLGDLGRINGELQKLTAYTLGRDVVELKDVEAICSVTIEDKVFDMIEAIACKNKKMALSLYFDQLAIKESPTKILILLGRHFRALLQVIESPPMPLAELAKSIGSKGVASFVAAKYQKQVKTFTKEKLKELVEGFAKTEEEVKTGKINERTGVELMLAEALL